MKFAFSDGDFQPFVSGGMGLHVPMSNSSNVLVNISSTSVFFGNVGANFRSGDMFYTALFEYGLFPPSQTVSTTIMALRAGAGWHW